ncbi:MAG: flippase-like domain-containing protein, partial [Candidatus Obscuribacterales bacterium]|nr:flippase-like domain-containing protein [Candidatus Obscuribacterales bacterium]
MSHSPIAKSPNSKDTNIKSGTSFWKILLAFLLAIGLLWWVFKDCDLNAIIDYSKRIDPIFVVLTLIVGLISHILRAARWIILLKPVANRSISLWNSFYSIIAGYVVNIIVPRGGEVVRLVFISRLEKLPWPGVAPTVFIDRLLDIVLLVLLFAASVPAIPKSIHDQMPWLLCSSMSLMAITIIALALLPKGAQIMTWFKNLEFVKKKMPEPLSKKLDSLIEQFHQGTRCITDPVAYPMILALTAGMWFCYFLNFYMMIFAFHLQEKVGMLACFLIFTIGSLGNLVPTPGSVGGFHAMVIMS